MLEIKQCIFNLKNLENQLDKLLLECNKVKQQHIQDSVLIEKLNKEIETLKNNLENDGRKENTDESTQKIS
jgi:iron-sulfur cluster repair protein YtfE (RIC family)